MESKRLRNIIQLNEFSLTNPHLWGHLSLIRRKEFHPGYALHDFIGAKFGKSAADKTGWLIPAVAKRRLLRKVPLLNKIRSFSPTWMKRNIKRKVGWTGPGLFATTRRVLKTGELPGVGLPLLGHSKIRLWDKEARKPTQTSPKPRLGHAQTNVRAQDLEKRIKRQSPSPSNRLSKRTFNKSVSSFFKGNKHSWGAKRHNTSKIKMGGPSHAGSPATQPGAWNKT